MSDKTNFESLGEQYEREAPVSAKHNIDGNRNLFTMLGGFLELMVPQIFGSVVRLFGGSTEASTDEKVDTSNH